LSVCPRDFSGERRVALVPSVIPNLAKAGLEVVIEAGAGAEAGYPDAEYVAKGGKVLRDRAEVFRTATLSRKFFATAPMIAPAKTTFPSFIAIKCSSDFFAPRLRRNHHGHRLQRSHLLLGGTDAAHHTRAKHGCALLHGHHLRIQSRAHRRRLLAEDFPMMTTAAGTITPARVLILGVGVAGLQAIATARRLGAVVSAYDVRPAVKEQVQSLGARFVELPIEAKDAQDARGYATAQGEEFYRKQRELLGKVIAEHDVVITAAVVPGKKSPVLVTKEMVAGMVPGSLLVDLAAERGGNCELTRGGEKINVNGVTIIGFYNLASTVPYNASQMYARNLTAFLLLMVKDGKLQSIPRTISFAKHY